MKENVDSYNRNQLRSHHLAVRSHFHHRQTAVKVKNFHFYVLETAVYTTEKSGFSISHEHEIQWDYDHSPSVYGINRAIELALQALYILDIPVGECIVQRNGDHHFAVVSVKEYSISDLSEKNKRQISKNVSERASVSLSFGTDIEVLARHQSKRWIPASALLDDNDVIGWDDYTILRKNKMIQPVIELRPHPAQTAKRCYNHIHRSYTKLQNLFQSFNLKAACGSNPYARIFLGGHLHVGNQLASFPLVRRLDGFLTLPFALLLDNGAQKRRKSHGRLGAVRLNSYNGFEYRSLPSWYHLIPSFYPVIAWFVYLQTRGETLPSPVLTDETITAYYRDDKEKLSAYVRECEQMLRATMSDRDYIRFALPFFDWLNRNSNKEINVVRERL